MAKRSPILGYNHNVRYRGIVLHVQTEDSGIMNPHVFSHLFHGGVILSTRKLVYDPDATEDVVKALMQAQHKAVMKDLRRGMFDDKIDQYLGGTPGLLPRTVGADAEAAGEPAAPAAPAAAPPPVPAPIVEAELSVEPSPFAPPPAVAVAPVAEDPAFAEPALIRAAPLEPAPLEPAPLELAPLEAAPLEAAPLEAAPLVEPEPEAEPEIDPEEILDAEPLLEGDPPPTEPETPSFIELADPSPRSITAESSGPAIEVIEAMEPLDLELGPSRAPSFDLDSLPPPPVTDISLGDDSPFEGVTARTPPPAGATEDLETERVPVMAFPELEPAPGQTTPPPVTRTSVRITTPPVNDTQVARVSTPVLPQVARVETPVLPQTTRAETPVPTRVEPGRSGSISAVRVSFVSARGPAPVESPRADSEPHRDQPSTYDVVSLDAIETPPTGVSSFEDLLPPPLPPPPTSRGPGPGATPPFGVATGRATRPAIHETVPRLAGVPAPTPTPTPGPTTPHGMVAVPPPPPPPPAHVHGSHPALARPGTIDPAQRMSLHGAPAIDDDDLQAAGLVESGDVVEIHSPPLPSATAPPGAAPERPGEYRVTRREPVPAARPTTPPRAPAQPPRPPPSPTRPQVSASASAPVRGGTPPATPVVRQAAKAAPTRPPTAQMPAPPAPRPDTSRSEPMAAQPRPPTGQRPAPRPRPTTGAGVVVSRPAVIVGAPQRPAASPAAPVRTRRARDTGSDGLITERSLDEVILAYLSEDGSEE